MNYRVNTNFEEMCLVVEVAVNIPCDVAIKIFDQAKPKTLFTDRWTSVTNTTKFHINLPITSEDIIVSVFDKKIGNLPENQENNIKVLSVKKTTLKKRMDVVDIHNPAIAEFIEFAQRFCFNSSYVATNKTYQSDGGRFFLEYFPVIIGHEGKQLKTPARISKLNGRIQVAKEYFDRYTVPMRLAILCHEFSHFNLNVNMDNESEADINGFLIYLGLGYPRIEGLQAFYEVFKETPSNQNEQRMKIIRKFTTDFSEGNIIFK
jgi:hypothetical protein